MPIFIVLLRYTLLGMFRIKQYCTVTLFLLTYQMLSAQLNVKDSCVLAPLIIGSYSVQIPGGDMADRFGVNSNVGGYFLIKNRSNLLYGVGGGFLFGDNVRETSIFSNVTTSNDYIIDSDGQIADVYLHQRGFNIALNFGKVLNVLAPNPNSGLFGTVGLGFLQHKIKIEDVLDNVLQIQGEYIKGYDRLTNGVMVSEMIGYMYLSSHRLVNFFVGFEFSQGFTKSRRSYNFNTMEYDDKDRLDLLYGFRVGWIIPAYKRTPREFYFY